jgi:hypothetical protein
LEDGWKEKNKKENIKEIKTKIIPALEKYFREDPVVETEKISQYFAEVNFSGLEKFPDELLKNNNLEKFLDRVVEINNFVNRIKRRKKLVGSGSKAK